MNAPDGKVKFDQLYSNVYKDCQKYGQEPLLLQSGVGLAAEPPEGITIAEIPRANVNAYKARKEKEAKEEEENSKKESGENVAMTGSAQTRPVAMQQDTTTSTQPDEAANDNEENTADSDKDGEGQSNEKDAQPSTDDTPKDSKSQPNTPQGILPAPKDTEETDFDRNDRWLRNVWARRDHLENSSGDEWSPIDYAPHAWRQYVEFLVDLESRHYGGAEFDVARIKTELEIYNNEGDVINDGVNRSPIGSRRVVSQFYQTKKRFDNRPGIQLSPKDLGDVGRAVQDLNRAIFRVPDYFRWHSWSLMVEETDNLQSIQDVLDAIINLQRDLHRFEGKSIDVVQDPMDQFVADVRRSRFTLELATQKLERAIFEFNEETIEQKLKLNDPLQYIEWQKVEFLLSTPLPTYRQRRQLLAMRSTLEHSEQTYTQPPTKLELSPGFWTGLESHLKLYRRVSEIPDQSGNLLSDDEFSQATDDERFEALHHAGISIKNWYAHLSSDDGLLNAQRLRLADARDDTIQNSADVCLPFSTPRILNVKITDGLRDGVLLVNSQESNLGIQVETNSESKSYTLTPTFPDGITVSYNGNELESGSPVEDQEIDKKLTLKVASDGLSTRSNSGTHKLRIEVKCDNDAGSKVRDIKISYDEIFVEVGPSYVRDNIEETSGVRLRPFPGHDTRFNFSLRNNTRFDKKISEIKLYALPPIQSLPLRKGRLYVGGKLHEDIEKIRARIRENDFTDLEQVASVFIDPKEGYVIKGNRTKPCKFKLEGEDSPSEGVDPFNGLVMVVTDLDSNQYIRFFEIDPLHPSEYLEPEMTYDESDEQIFARFKLKKRRNGDQFPDDFPNFGPIVVSWNTRVGYPQSKIDDGTVGYENQGPGKSHYAEIDPKNPNKDAELFWDFTMNRRGSKRSVHRFDVDGYPRAFRYLLDLNNTGDRRWQQLEGNRHAELIRINWMHNGTESEVFKTHNDFSRLYHAWKEKPNFGKDDEILQKKKARGFYRSDDRKKEAVFTKSDFVVAEVQVDASAEIFTKFSLISDSGVSNEFRDLRDISGSAKAKGLGDIDVTTIVRDHRIKMSMRGSEGRFAVKAELSINDGGERREGRDEVTLHLVPQKPEVKLVLDQAKYSDKEQIVVTLDDPPPAGVDTAKTALVETRQTPVTPEFATPFENRDGIWQARLNPPQRGLKTGRNWYYVKGQLVDRVGNEQALGPVRVLIEVPEVVPVNPSQNNDNTNSGSNNGVNPQKPVKPGPLRLNIILEGARDGILDVKTTIRGEEISKGVGSTGGRVTFNNVPVGKYKVEVTGILGGRDATGEREITLASEDDYKKIYRVIATKK